MDLERRKFMAAGLAASIAGLAGCSSPSNSSGATTDESTTTTTTSTTTSDESTGDVPPGRDQLGGPGDLQSSASVDALTLSEDRGAGQFVFSPAVVWVEPGATVTWEIDGGSHSITAYHPDNGKQLRVPEGTSGFDSGVLSSGDSFEHTFETEGVYDYYCTPHEGLGMVGLVVVGGPAGGPGTTDPGDVSNATAGENLAALLDVAGIDAGGGQEGQARSYGWTDATWDSYWYSLYNMSTNIAMSGNGVRFPHNEQQQQALQQRLPAMLEAADQAAPPIANPYLNMAAFTEGDPHFTQEPVFDDGSGRPDASTLRWDRSESSGVVSPASLSWTHLKGVTWAKNFEAHFDVLPDSLAAEFRSQVLTTLAQIGVNASLIAGGPEGNGALTKGESLELVSGFAPGVPEVTDSTSRPHQHAAMLWFLSDLTSLATGGWFGYENPEPLIPAENVQQLTDGMARTTMDLFAPEDVVETSTTRDLGLLLGAVGWYGTHAGSDELRSAAAEYANEAAGTIESNLNGNGAVRNGATNRAATQGVVGQGLLWASEIDGVDHADTAGSVLGYMFDELWDEDAGTFAPGANEDVYTITARDVGDVTGGVNAADAVLGIDGVRDVYARYFNQTVNRGRLQRAQRPQSVDENAEHGPTLPPEAGGEYGQAAVYNAEVEYDTGADEWSVTDDRFDTEWALYLANQEIWISQWGGEFFEGRGVPGTNDTPE